MERRIDLTSYEEDETIWEERIRTWVRPSQEARQDPCSDQEMSYIIDRVPQRLRRLGKEDENSYDPQLISLGPYHHQKQESLQFGRRLKYKILETYVCGCRASVSGLYKKVYGMVEYARGFYLQDFTKDYCDDEFAAMMLLDGCFILHTFESHSNPLEQMIEMLLLQKQDGVLGREILYRDMFLLENQLPFPVLQELMSFKHTKQIWESTLNRSFSFIFFGNHLPLDPKLIIFDRTGPRRGTQLFHLLDIAHQLFCHNHDQDIEFLVNQIERKKNLTDLHAEDLSLNSYPTYSVMELKSKGIHFRPSTSQSTNKFYSHITFKPCFSYGQIKIPPVIIRPITKSILLNLLAYEVSPHTPGKGIYVGPYVSLMRSLINDVRDVKELKSQGIVLNYFASDEEVVKMFKEIDFSPRNYVMFLQVLTGIKGHINSRGKTWTAQLISKYFSTPWTLTAFLASLFLLVLTLFQTYFTIRPAQSD